ncbi:unnamed protein product [Diamesa hyperborea]
MFKFILLILCNFLLINLSENAKILGIFPTPSISHQVVFRALMKDLSERGHQLTILTTDPSKTKNPNVTVIDFHDCYKELKHLSFVEFKETKQDQSSLMMTLNQIYMSIMEDHLNHPEVKKLLQNKDTIKFDLVILEYLNYVPMLAFAEHFDAPVIGITSLDTFTSGHELMGNEANPVIHPEILFSHQHGKLNFWDRYESLKYDLRVRFSMQPNMDKKFIKFIAKHFPNVTASLDDMKQRVAILMTNTHPAMGFNRPILPNTIQLGFMHIEKPKPLPAGDLKSFLDNSKNGVIYMSLGSNVQSKDLGQQSVDILLKVFGSIKYDVLWKWEADILPNKPDNVKISKWLPQSDLLAHPKIKLFITQGGQQSMEEAIDRTVPLIVIPFLGDQDANAQRMKSKGIGYPLDLHSLSESSLKEAINEMLKPKYKKNIEELRELIYDQPMTSRERAVWWTEYVLRHKGAKHLKYAGIKTPFYQRYWLDFISIGLLLIAAMIKSIYLIINLLRTNKKVKKN